MTEAESIHASVDLEVAAQANVPLRRRRLQRRRRRRRRDGRRELLVDDASQVARAERPKH